MAYLPAGDAPVLTGAVAVATVKLGLCEFIVTSTSAAVFRARCCEPVFLGRLL